MSKIQTYPIQCQCGNIVNVALYHSANVSIDPHLKAQIRLRKLNNYYCEKCQEYNELAFPFLYHDMKNKKLVWCYPERARKDEKKIKEELREKIKQPIFKILNMNHIKLVFGYDELFDEIGFSVNSGKTTKTTDQGLIEMNRDKDWSVIDSEPCRVIYFTSIATVNDGKIITPKMPESYASVFLECKKFSKTVKGFVNHRLDFLNLWKAFKERDISDNEEVIIFWSSKHYKYKFLKYFSAILPKMWILVCKKGAFELMSDSNYKPELNGIDRWEAIKPITEWKPEIMA